MSYIDQSKEFYFYIENNKNNANIIPVLYNEKNEESFAEKCPNNFKIDDFNGDIYCFNLSFYHLRNKGFQSLNLYCKDNCTLDGKDSVITIRLYTKNLKIEHDKNDP